MGRNELISVVIPAFNAARYITDAVKSCLAQSYRPLEVVVVNDGSTDDTPLIVKKLQSEYCSDFKVQLIDIKPNQGAANALRTGFSAARGKFICWLSADDMFIDHEKIARQARSMEKCDAAWSYYRRLYAGSSLAEARLVIPSYLPWFDFLDTVFVHSPELRLMSLFFNNPINGSSIMIRKDCIERYGTFDPVTRNVDGDGDLWMRFSYLGLKVVRLNGAPVFYREHAGQTSKQQTLMIHGCSLTRLRLLSFLEEQGRLEGLIKKFAFFIPFVVETHSHDARPFVAEYIFRYIAEHEGRFGWLLSKYARRALNQLEEEIDVLGIDRKKCVIDTADFRHSSTFQSFEKLARSTLRR